MAKLPDITIDLDEVNHTELVQLCHWAGIESASRGWPRDLLVFCLKNFEPVQSPDPLVDLKGIVSDWLKRYWERIAMQAPKKVCPNCHLCRDVEVLECYRKNRDRIGGRDG